MPRHGARALLLALAVALACLPGAAQLRLPSPPQRPPASPASGQSPTGEATFRVDVNLVSFPATVTDSYGRYVSDLRREQLGLFEDGVPQAIAVFHNEVVPVSVGIVLDTSGSMGYAGKLTQAVDALEHFVNTIQPDDDVFLMRFAGTVELELDFTGNRDLFSQAARQLEARGATRLYDALAEALEKVNHGRHRKKALLLITDGNDTSSFVAFREVLEMARQSEVLVYCMGIGYGEGQRTSPGGRRQKEEGVDMGVLEAIADATGGRAFHLEHAHRGGSDLIDDAAQQVSSELRQQYTVGYYPTNPTRDGTYRTIRLMASVPGVQVRHRRGYYAPKQLTADTR